jgi:hypothetical protein
MGPCVLAIAGLEGRCPDGISSFCDDYVAESVHRQAQDRLAGTTLSRAQPQGVDSGLWSIHIYLHRRRRTHASLTQDYQRDTDPSSPIYRVSIQHSKHESCFWSLCFLRYALGVAKVTSRLIVAVALLLHQSKLHFIRAHLSRHAR